MIKIWTRGQILAQKSTFSKFPQNERELSPRHHEPNATRFVSNGRRERDIAICSNRQIGKKSVDCAVHIVCMDVDVAGPYIDVVGLYMMTWNSIIGRFGRMLFRHVTFIGQWCGATWPSHGLPRGTPLLAIGLLV
jgi:hypothetical protein